jgi:formylglycine-generating enzyme
MCTDHRVPAALFAVSLVALGPFATAVAAQHTPPNKTGACASPGEGDGVNMVFTPGGNFTMGSDRHRPEERYTHVVSLDGFWIDRTEVTNAQFGKFVAATGYVTLAERGGDPKVHVNMPKQFLEAGSVVFIKPTDVSSGGSVTQWFQYVSRADWRHPEGPGTSIAAREDHPVVHVAYEDAMAYARWLGHSLPTEAQWEYAARGGRDGEDDLSSAFDADGKPTANTWQGIFPVLNSKDDGYAGTAPVGCFRPNGYGLYDMIGNVWEWTSDWYRPGHPRVPAAEPQGAELG